MSYSCPTSRFYVYVKRIMALQCNEINVQGIKPPGTQTIHCCAILVSPSLSDTYITPNHNSNYNYGPDSHSAKPDSKRYINAHTLTISVYGKWRPCSDNFIVADLAVLWWTVLVPRFHLENYNIQFPPSSSKTAQLATKLKVYRQLQYFNLT